MKSFTIILGVLAFFIVGKIPAQDLPARTGWEKVTFFSDRNLYLSGEPVFFTAVITTFGEKDTACSSRVLYVELVSPDGTAFVKGKFRISGDKSSGRLNIPKDMISGNYDIKTYTRYDRNFGSGSFSYVPVTVVNPYSGKVLESKGGGKTVPLNATPGQLREIEVSTSRDEYTTRDSVYVTFDIKDTPEEIRGLCISVVPAGTFSPQKSRYYREPGHNTGKFHHEADGIALSGRLLEGETAKPLVVKTVNLSVPGEKDFLAVDTDSSGRFSFTMPFFDGDRDLFLSTEKTTGIRPEIMVDNDYDTEVPILPAIPFDLDSLQKETALLLAANIEVEKKFLLSDSIRVTGDADVTGHDKRPFYGKAAYVLNIDEYIELPSLEEYFNELALPARIGKEHGKKRFIFNSTLSGMTVHPPLVLIDWVAIDDVEKIMACHPSKIDRVEFVDKPYDKGGMIYGGIISVISKEGDFGGIDLPSSGIFLNYGFLRPDIYKGTPQSDFAGPHLPDTRNMLMWDPELTYTPGKPMHISFRLADTKTTYVVVIRAVDENGRPMHGTSRFAVGAHGRAPVLAPVNSPIKRPSPVR